MIVRVIHSSRGLPCPRCLAAADWNARPSWLGGLVVAVAGPDAKYRTSSKCVAVSVAVLIFLEVAQGTWLEGITRRPDQRINIRLLNLWHAALLSERVTLVYGRRLVSLLPTRRPLLTRSGRLLRWRCCGGWLALRRCTRPLRGL